MTGLALEVGAQAPGPRNQPGAVAMPDGDEFVLFGGQSPTGEQLDETWLCTPDGWTRLPGPGPAPRSTPLARAPNSEVLLFGGYDGGRLSDTWLLHGRAWREVAVDGPPPRSGHALAYDEARGVTVLFGGAGVDGFLGDTWEWDGATWTEIRTAGPSARRNHAMGYDPQSRRVVLFGGSDDSGRTADTWLWDGTAWEEHIVAGPDARDHHAITSASDGVFLFGGWGGDYLADLWQWSEEGWRPVDGSGPSRAGRPAFVSVGGALALFGGGADSGFVADLRIFERSAWFRRDGCAREPPPGEDASDRRTVGSIERLFPAFDDLVPEGAEIEILADGHAWTEGPVWVEELDGLLYSDIPANAIYLYRDEMGSRPWLEATEAEPGGSGGANGLILDAAGALLLAQHGARRVARLTSGWGGSERRFETVVADFDGRPLNSPNDLIEGPDGSIYFTDPPYGLAGQDDDPAKEQVVNGVYRVQPDGELELVDATLSRPNGIVLSPDASTLYVANSGADERVVRAYPRAEDGSIGDPQIFADTWGDGMAVDRAGNVYVAEPELGVYVFDPSGRHVGSFLTGGRTSNVAWGDDGSSLYITAGPYLMRVRLAAVGLGF
ncbi:MAG: SMP-30/gluconolactonase/LRE family protein [Gemmatimonadota bacterium]